MHIHDYKKRLEKVEISEKLNKDLDILEKEDIEAFLEWVQSNRMLYKVLE